eukprot:Tbor_TRINITY_DN4532_c0_g1::TRINITY_DN4532_c0_g1_i1::g.15892::m.15892
MSDENNPHHNSSSQRPQFSCSISNSVNKNGSKELSVIAIAQLNNYNELCKNVNQRHTSTSRKSILGKGAISNTTGDGISKRSVSPTVQTADSRLIIRTKVRSTHSNSKNSNVPETNCNIGYNTTAALVPETTGSNTEGLFEQRRQEGFLGNYGDMRSSPFGRENPELRPISPKTKSKRGISSVPNFTRSHSGSSRPTLIGRQSKNINDKRPSKVTNEGFELAEICAMDVISFGSSSGSVQLRIDKCRNRSRSSDHLNRSNTDDVIGDCYGKFNRSVSASVISEGSTSNSTGCFIPIRVSFDCEKGRLVIQRFSIDIWAGETRNNGEGNKTYGSDVCRVSKDSLETYGSLLFSDIISMGYRHGSKSADYDRPPGVTLRTKKLLIVPHHSVNVSTQLSESGSQSNFLTMHNAILTFSSCFPQKAQAIFKLLHFKAKGIFPLASQFISRSPKRSQRLGTQSPLSFCDYPSGISGSVSPPEMLSHNIPTKVPSSPSTQMEYTSPYFGPASLSYKYGAKNGHMSNDLCNKRDSTGVFRRQTETGNEFAPRDERLDRLMAELDSLHASK